MAGGGTQAGGNGSIWWRVRHFTGAPADPATGKKPGKPQKVSPATKPLPDVDEVKVDDEVSGHDDTPVTPGMKFTTTLRYKDEAEARAALAAATISSGKGGYYVMIKTPVIDRKNPNEDQPFEVDVEW